VSRRRAGAGGRTAAQGGRTRVIADGSRRTLLVDGLEASVVDLADPLYLEMPYMRWIAALVTASVVTASLPASQLRSEIAEVTAPVVTASLPTSHLRSERAEVTAPVVGQCTRAADVLHLGGGACTLARWLAATRPGSRSRVFEVDAEVVAVAREEMALDDVPGLRVSAVDARAGVASLRPRSFDVVVADVFVGPRVPDHLCTVEALEDVRRVLRPGGAYVANLIDEAPLRRSRRQIATIVHVFGPVTLIAERATLTGRRAGNLVAAAGRTFGGGPIGRAAKRADVLDGAAVDLWCGAARPLRDAPKRD
jgi:SAM-dependent methyltransferase